MSILTLTYHASVRSRGRSGSCSRIRARVLALNERGIVTILLLGVCACAIAVYIGSMVALFHQGFFIQKLSAEEGRIQEDVLKSEIALGHDDADFAQIHKDVVGGMEKISSITYLADGKEVTAMAGPADQPE